MTTRKVIIPEGMENIYDTYHYAPAIQVGNTLYLSGQVGRDENLNVVEGTEAQFVQAFENVKRVLDAAGAGFEDVVELETWFSDSMADLQTFLEVKDRYFTAAFPTWTGFAVKGFSMPGILVEIKCKAVLGLTAA
ncbi:RidA family protein [Roseobacter sp. YSTF-M11]|uniref:RidA family protein n=1 Tax=Roseobacter insulae TaxID=2859783 RepID=A0A9X1K0B9_9RHOB|nr:RidA family protein [Roseobacter insulae]MBW4706318.1 RidA family protein [Roseobacter insulae]